MRGQVVVVTGASAGIGRALVRELAGSGARIALLARDPDRLEATRREVVAAGGSARAFSLDVADSEAVERAAAEVDSELGPIDVWINNAMATVLAPVAQMPAHEYQRVTEVTYLGAVYGTLAALRRMRPRNSGHIIQVGSALAYRAIPLQSAYCAAKHALRGFTDSLRSELIHDGSKVLLTSVHLPAMNTPQFDWGRTRLPNQPQPVPPIYQPEVAARAIAAVIGKRRREVYVGMSTVKAITASKFLPAFLDWYLAKRAYSGQQTETPLPPGREDNLFLPVRGDFGAHGRFDDCSRAHSLQTWLATHRLAAAGLASVLGAGAALIGWRAR
jgi:short-subunit dehydrogenase